MMGALLAAARTCRPDDTVYGGGDVVTGCLPDTGADLWPLVLIGLALICAGLVLAAWKGRLP